MGEPLEFAPTSSAVVERLFLEACREIPQRFIGALRSRKRQRYVIALNHYRLDTVRFEFSCGRSFSLGGIIRVYLLIILL